MTNIKKVLSNIDNVLKFRTSFQEKYTNALVEIELAKQLLGDKPYNSIKGEVKNFWQNKSSKISDYPILTTNSSFTSLLASLREYEDAILYVDTLRDEYLELRENKNGYYEKLTVKLLQELFGEFSSTEDIIYDTSLDIFIDKNGRRRVEHDEIFKLFTSWLLDNRIFFMSMTFFTMDEVGNTSYKNYANPQTDIAAMKVPLNTLNAPTLAKLMKSDIVDNACKESYMRDRIEENAAKWDGIDRITGFGEAFLGLDKSTLTDQAMRLWLTHPLKAIYDPSQHIQFSILINAKGGTGKSYLTEGCLDPALKRVFGDILYAKNLQPKDKPVEWLDKDDAADKQYLICNAYAGFSDWNVADSSIFRKVVQRLNEPAIPFRHYYGQIIQPIRMLSVPFFTINSDTLKLRDESTERRTIKLKSVNPNIDDKVIGLIKSDYKRKYLDELKRNGLFEQLIYQASNLAVNMTWDELADIDFDEVKNIMDENASVDALSVTVKFGNWVLTKPYFRNQIELQDIGNRELKDKLQLTYAELDTLFDEYRDEHPKEKWQLSRLIQQKHSFGYIFVSETKNKDGKKQRYRVLYRSALDEAADKIASIMHRDGLFIDINDWVRNIVLYYNSVSGNAVAIPSNIVDDDGAMIDTTTTTAHKLPMYSADPYADIVNNPR